MNNDISVRWHRLRVLAAILIAGITIGIVAFGVKHAIAALSRLITTTFDPDSSNLILLFSGIASITVSGLIVRKVVKMPLEHSTSRIKNDLKTGRAPLPWRLTIAPVAVNAITLGLGGSAGAEGPIAYSGGAIASRVAALLRLPEKQLIIFLACGAGAGIAAIFKAPLGGFFFTIEVLRFPLSPAATITLALICLTAGLTAYAAGNFAPDIPFGDCEPMSAEWYPAIFLLGIVCGLYSLYYYKTGKITESRLSAIRRPLFRNLLAGTFLGVCLLLFPSLYGEGYGVLDKVLNGNMTAISAGSILHETGGTPLIAATLAGLLLIKPFATYATNSGGGVAGEFAPTIFAGGLTGALFVMCASSLPGCSDMPAGDFIAIAMAAVMAGAIKAPLMAIFIVTEATSSPSLLLPLSIASGTSYLIANFKKFSKTKR